MNWTALEAMGWKSSETEKINADGEESMEDPENKLKRNSYESIKERILNWARFDTTKEENPLIINSRQIRTDKHGEVRTIDTSKRYHPVITNAVVTQNYNVIPFGYNGPNK